MDSTTNPPIDRNNPASAFADLRGEVSLLRRAVEGLTAERQNAPDYTPTLTGLSRRLANVEELLGKVTDSPSMRLTPENLAVSIAKASETARAGDRDLLDKAGGTLRTSISSINAVVEQAWTADCQLKLLCWTGGGGLFLGALGVLSILHLIG
jgi:hypothetical protein